MGLLYMVQVQAGAIITFRVGVWSQGVGHPASKRKDSWAPPVDHSRDGHKLFA
jgi:hypothetical protein